LCVLALLALLLGRSARAAEDAFEDRPAGDSVESLDSALSRAVEKDERKRTLFPRAKRFLQRFPPFIAATELVYQARTYYLPLKKPDGSTAYAWTLGGKLRYRSGWWRDTVQLGFGLYQSYKLTADDPLALTQLLQPGERSYTVAGEALLRLRWRELEASLYRQELVLPWVNKSDSRMTPNSFQGYLVRGKHEKVGWFQNLDWVAGWISDIRPRFDDEFISMGARAGALDSNQGMWLAGAQFDPSSDIAGAKLHVGLYNYFVKDVLHISYGAVDFLRDLPGDWQLRTQWQVSWQSSAGGTELTGEHFDTGVVSMRSALSYAGVTGWLGFSVTRDTEDIRSPWGTYPGFLSMMNSDFNAAGETAWMVGGSYDFAGLGLPNLSAFFQYARGTGGRDTETGADRADEQELNLTFDYKIKEGRWRGLWFRVRGSLLGVEGAESLGHEFRVLLQYDIPVL
jgi:hypothetical protein